MGLQLSKEELLYQKVRYGDIESIKSLRSEGAGLEWIDWERKTPLILACMESRRYDVAKALIELGADVNAFRPGGNGGTPLHHAAGRGLEQMVILLLSHGANALVMNDDSQTALDIARVEGYSNVVRAIENHICLFSGWLHELYGPGLLQIFAPQLFSTKLWVVVLPCGARELTKPFKLELAIYSGLQDAKPRSLMPLWKANMDEPDFNKPDPSVVISSSNEPRIKLAPVNENEKQQLQRFCKACKGIPQVMNLANPTAPPSVPSALPISDMVDDGPVHYPPIDSTPIQMEKVDSDSSTCVICLDAPMEGACVPCGHMAGCMSCLTEVKGKDWGCPVCRTKIDQVVRIYAV